MKKSNSNDENPFKMPPDTDIFLLREREKQRKFNVKIAAKIFDSNSNKSFLTGKRN